ncbi:MAG TPA: xanthine dehydrogenase family protein molybdopterin-binding subunit [Nocardioidaceae bacterium]|nr:xanthine dehydrogenase family protein molybdopterin-binding subunit [Nocardioidaceae bacterium]
MPDTVGTDFRHRDAERRVLGTLEFVLDHKVEGMVHAKAVRSPLPHARVVAVHTEDALAMPGVIAVLTGQDLTANPDIDPCFGKPRADQPVLAIDKVRYAGDPVAIVVAETEHQAWEALPYVDVEYDELPYVVDAVQAARPGAPVVHDDRPDNNVATWRLRHGDCDSAMAKADRVYSDTYYSPPASHVPMEPMVCVAQWSEGQLEVWTSAQAPHAVRQGLEKVFGLPAGHARVHTLNVGGGYGAKGQVKIEPMVGFASLAVGRPVRMELSRDEVFQTIGKHATTVELTTGVMNDGTFVARRMHVNYNAGAYAVTSVVGAGQGLTRANGPYAIPNVAIDTVATYTNTVPCGPFRGAMTSQLAFAYESQIDDIARDLQMDPLALRRKNLLRETDVYPTGETLHDLHYDELLDDLAAAIDWTAPPAPAEPGRARGKGLGIIIKNTLTPSRSEAVVRLEADGTLRIFSSSVEMGQGANPTLAQIAADRLGVPVDRVALGFPDTAVTPFDTTTSSSRTTFSMGAAISSAAEDLQARLTALADELHGLGGMQLNHDDGQVTPAGRPEVRIAWTDLLEKAGLTELEGHGVFQTDYGITLMDPLDVKGPVSVHWHQGAAAAEVEVDLETGKVDVLRMHASCYAGRVVSPLRVEQQNQGCAVFGLGPTLFEELHYQDGTLSNPNLSDYMIPSIVDVPATITSTALESDDPQAELHGVGEMALPAVSPAVSNAIFAATGARITTLPLTPERVLQAIEEASTARGRTELGAQR